MNSSPPVELPDNGSRPSDGHPFIPTDNPFLEWLGVRVVDWRDHYAEMHLDLRPHLMNRTGRVQGGVLCTLLDVVCGYSGCYRPPGEPAQHALTLSLTTQFLDTGEGSQLIAIGRTEKVGRTVFFSKSEVWLDGSKLLASASGTFKYLKQRN